MIKGLPEPEAWLATRDKTLASVIDTHQDRWPCVTTEDPIWGLARIVIAQQVSTAVACKLADRLIQLQRSCVDGSQPAAVMAATLRGFGVPMRRAICCADVLHNSHRLLQQVRAGKSWEEVLEPIKGIGPWTISVFRIMVLRDPDVLPVRDVGLDRAVTTHYGSNVDLLELSANWRPYRSVACWHLWRTLGNQQLG